jgi:hypothetical protein
MKISTMAVIAALAGAGALAGCEDQYGYGYYPYGPYADVGYSAYYDGYYGDFYGGYWGPGGYFYYADRDGHHYHRDDQRHFRRESTQGYRQIQGRAPPARQQPQGQHRDRRPD